MSQAGVVLRDWEQTLAAFLEATRWYQDVLTRVDARWGEPGPGEWDVRTVHHDRRRHADGHTATLLLATTGRPGLPPCFSVL